MTAPYYCPTPCDPDCEISGWGCHEAHGEPKRQEHDPETCEARTLAGNLRWLIGDEWEVQIGRRDPADPLMPFYVKLKADRGSWLLYGVSPGEVLAKAREWAQCAPERTAP